MTDIIVISLEEFNKIKNTITLDLQIKEKYEGLFNKYDCFFKTNIGNNGVIPKKGQSTYSKKEPVFEVMSKTHYPKKIKTTSQEVTGLLNIMNRQNYSKVLSKFRFLLSKENIQSVMKEILIKCCLQIVYKDLYIRLILDITELSGYDDVIRSSLALFFDDYISKKQIVFCGNNKTDICEYDIFCNQQKHKSITLARNILFLDLFKHKLLKVDINHYIQYIIECVDQHLNDEYHLDIILSIILHIMDSSFDISEENLTKIINILDNITINCPNKKILFTLDNIRFLITSKSHS